MVSGMTPDTIHLVAQMIRHQRAMATSFETWIRKQPRSPACRELLQVVAVQRGIFDQIESQLSQMEVEIETSV
jgi:hypothetical protein